MEIRKKLFDYLMKAFGYSLIVLSFYYYLKYIQHVI
jgi:hypothetical protein